MQQDQRLTFALFDIVEGRAPQFHELPYGWIVALRLFRSEPIYERRDRKGYDNDCGARSDRVCRVTKDWGL
jgi:hypothetical protein